MSELDDPEVLEKLKDPRISLPLFGKVMHQKDDTESSYDPHAITERLQQTILSYIGDPPRRAGQVAWLALLGYRQGGKSTVGELGFYPKAAYTPGWDHVCIADRHFRADYLHTRVHYCHERWDDRVRSPKVPARESRQLTFGERGGKMRTLSMETGAVGIGQTPNSFHWSEVPFARGAATQWTMISPSMINKDNALVLLESTPAPADEPSVEFWRETCYEAKKGAGRWIYAFFPFWDGKLNRRAWPKDWTPTNEELDLLNRYGGQGLTLENLSFRRLIMETDTRVRRNPELFNVFYPFDDVSCWIAGVRGVIPREHIERQLKRLLVPWGEGTVYKEYEDPQEDAVYVVGVDPTGFGARDHASFQILKVYAGEWTQVATFATHIGDPPAFTRELVRAATRYNNAYICVESNGVGAGVLSLLQEHHGYRNIFYQAHGKPGKASTGKSVEEMLGWLIDALIDTLNLNDEDTVDQLLSYQNDKRIEDSARQEHARQGEVGKGRRPRHHWDKVSALIMAVVAARDLPQRAKPGTEKKDNVILFKDMGYNRQQEHHVAVQRDRVASSKRSRYVSVRRGKKRRR